MMTPPPLRCIDGITSRLIRKAPVKLTRSAWSQSSGDNSVILARMLAAAALLTRIAISPSRLMTF